MSAIFIMLACSILVAGAFLIAFIWSVTSGQYEDDHTPSIRILFDDENVQQKVTDTSNKQKPTSNAN